MLEQAPCHIRYLAPSQRDLIRFRDYLISGGVSHQRVQEIIKEIVVNIHALAANPRIEFSIGGKYGFSTPYRGLVCGKYIAIYEVFDVENGAMSDDDVSSGRSECQVEIRRIYHVREDYVNQLIVGSV